MVHGKVRVSQKLERVVRYPPSRKKARHNVNGADIPGCETGERAADEAASSSAAVWSPGSSCIPSLCTPFEKLSEAVVEARLLSSPEASRMAPFATWSV